MRRLPSPRRSRSATGVALIEVLVSILLFSLGILGLIGLQTRAIRVSIDAEDRNRAALLADEIVTQMWMLQTPNIPADTKTAWQTRIADPTLGGLPGGEGSIEVTGKQADVTITWLPVNRAAGEGSNLKTRVVLP